ncbi:MAG: thioredoxin [Firmicutes bacterium]|nr:thioredoxin [Bacillota bacterium]
MGKHTVEVTDQSFKQEVVEHNQPVLVDFWAAWCGPCKMIGPLVEELAEEYQDKIKVAKVDVDNNRGVAGEFGITSIPTLMLFKDGQVVDRVVGFRPKNQLKQMIDQKL